MFTDSHCHLSLEYYDDIQAVIDNGISNNIHKFITNADSIKSSYEVLSLIKNYDCLYGTIGIHPEYEDDNVYILEKLLKDNIDNKKLIAIGEIGLDYHYEKINKDKQIFNFDYQLSLAEKYNLPVIIHSRDATLDTINILKKHRCKGVIHCFSGSIETAKEYIKMGYYIGVGGVVTFKNAKIKDVIKQIPIDRILLETDSPFLSPEPLRGHKNEPANIKYIASFVSELLQIESNLLSAQTELNIKTLFSI